VTSPQASGLIQPQQQSVGLNGFNRGDLVEFLNMRKAVIYKTLVIALILLI
jgi:hypothetical protein